MSEPRSESTPAEALQLQREWRQEENARAAALNSRSRLRELRKESVTEYGQAMLRGHTEAVAVGLEARLHRWTVKPEAAGPQFGALPLLASLGSTERAAAVGMLTVLDRLSFRGTLQAAALAVGRAIEAELRASELKTAAPAAYEGLLRRPQGERRRAVLRMTPRGDQGPWSGKQQAAVGLLVLDVIRAETGLVRIERGLTPGRRSSWRLEPTDKALELIARIPLRQLYITREPMVVPPVPWRGLIGGGYLSGDSPLVRRVGGEGQASIAYLSGRTELQLEVVNHLQGQPLAIDPWMLEQQRTAWDADVRGLFPVERDPPADPGPFPAGEDPAVVEAWQRQRDRHRADRERHSHKRLQIERSLQAAEGLADRTIWQAFYMDFRGRLFTASRILSHQGPDHQKALIGFAGAPPAGSAGADWMLMAAAGHWGLARATWDERLAWGKQNIERMASIAADPLGRLELWREAKQPWQFLQLARAFAGWLEDPGRPCGAPIRLDQTCSGAGIIAALLRDRATATHCNVTGSRPGDLYTVVAERVTHLLELDLHTGDERGQAMAAYWLRLGVDRTWLKAPVMNTPYGASHLSLVEGLQGQLVELLGELPYAEWRDRVYRPAHYLERVIRRALLQEVRPCMELRAWLARVGQKVVGRAQRPIEWTSPMGWPMRLADRTPDKAVIQTLLHGRVARVTFEEEPPEGELSLRITNRAAAANLVHSFDAALAHAVIYRAAAQGQQLLPNHDCFAAAPAAAQWLHRTLLDEFRSLYRTDWLAEITEEIRCRAGVPELPLPPSVGSLGEGEIGTNPYLFS